MKKTFTFLVLIFIAQSSFAIEPNKKVENMLNGYERRQSWDMSTFYNAHESKLNVIVKDFSSIDDSKIQTLASVLDKSMGLDDISSRMGFDAKRAAKLEPELLAELRRSLPKGASSTNSLISFFQMYLLEKDAQAGAEDLSFYKEYAEKFLAKARFSLGIKPFDLAYCAKTLDAKTCSNKK